MFDGIKETMNEVDLDVLDVKATKFKKEILPAAKKKYKDKLNSKSPIYLFHYEDEPLQLLVFNFNFLDKLAILEYKIALEETIHDISEDFKKSNYQDPTLGHIASKVIPELYKRLVYVGQVYVITEKNKNLTRGIDYIRYDIIKKRFMDYDRLPFPKGIEVITEKINLNEDE